MSDTTIADLIRDNAALIEALPVNHMKTHRPQEASKEVLITYHVPPQPGQQSGIDFLNKLHAAGGIEKDAFKSITGDVIHFITDPKNPNHRAIFERALPVADKRLEQAIALAPQLKWYTNNEDHTLLLNAIALEPQQASLMNALFSGGYATTMSGGDHFDYLLEKQIHQPLYDEIAPKAKERRAELVRELTGDKLNWGKVTNTHGALYSSPRIDPHFKQEVDALLALAQKCGMVSKAYNSYQIIGNDLKRVIVAKAELVSR
jgi:hypothetical protein